MTLLVTGGAVFIGGNCVLDWLSQSDVPIVNLDKLTYAGNRESLFEAATLIQTIEKREGLKVCSPEKTACRMGFIDSDAVWTLAEPLAKSGYGQQLLRMLEEKVF